MIIFLSIDWIKIQRTLQRRSGIEGYPLPHPHYFTTSFAFIAPPFKGSLPSEVLVVLMFRVTE